MTYDTLFVTNETDDCVACVFLGFLNIVLELSPWPPHLPIFFHTAYNLFKIISLMKGLTLKISDMDGLSLNRLIGYRGNKQNYKL